MSNIISNIPCFKISARYLGCVFYKLKSKKLKFGYNNIIKKSKFEAYNVLGDDVVLRDVSLGAYSYVSNKTQINKTKIGKFCSIGPNCLIGLGKHPFNEFISSHPLFYSSRNQVGFSVLNKSKYEEFEEIIIGNDVWIGAGVTILDGVKIGDGAVIGAGAVVTKDVEPFSLVVGVPAKHKKFKFEKVKIDEIKNDPWWDKDMEWIKENHIL